MENRTGQTFGHYRLTRLLGDRFYSQLYLGHHLQDSGPVLIRVLDLFQPLADDEAHFLVEMRQFTRLRHPHLLPIRDGGVQGRIPFLVMDYPPDCTLHDYLAEHLALAAIVSPINSLAATLQELHEQQVIHRPLHPDEVWMANHRPMLSEPSTTFERSLRCRQELIDYVIPDEVMERECSYLAPEQLAGQQSDCATSDQYALALMIYEWICGEYPFKGSWLKVTLQRLDALPPPLHEKAPMFPREVEAVVMRGLEKDPQKRFASLQAFVTALEQALLNEPGDGSSFSVEEGKEPGRVYEIHHPVVYVGRGKPGLDIALEDQLVAREHARLIHLKDGSYGIEDLNQVNGVLVNGRRLGQHELYPLRDRDRVQIGHTVLIFGSSRE